MAAAPTLRGAELELAIAIGLVIGVGGYTFLYVKGSSYVSNNPAACANSHSMR
jgi:cytochrome c nitrite reductase small subunit